MNRLIVITGAILLMILSACSSDDKDVKPVQFDTEYGVKINMDKDDVKSLVELAKYKPLQDDNDLFRFEVDDSKKTGTVAKVSVHFNQKLVNKVVVERFNPTQSTLSVDQVGKIIKYYNDKYQLTFNKENQQFYKKIVNVNLNLFFHKKSKNDATRNVALTIYDTTDNSTQDIKHDNAYFNDLATLKDYITTEAFIGKWKVLEKTVKANEGVDEMASGFTFIKLRESFARMSFNAGVILTFDKKDEFYYFATEDNEESVFAANKWSVVDRKLRLNRGESFLYQFTRLEKISNDEIKLIEQHENAAVIFSLKKMK